MKTEKNGGADYVMPSRSSYGLSFLFWAWRGSIWGFQAVGWHIYSQYHSNYHAACEQREAIGRVGACLEFTAIIQARDDGVQEWGGIKAGSEQWLDSGHTSILKVEPIGFSYRLKVGCGRKRMSSKFETWAKDGIAINRDGEWRRQYRFGKGNQEFSFGHNNFKMSICEELSCRH